MKSFSHFHFDKGMVSEEQKDFDEFRKKHGKEYSTREEYTYRLGVFRENMQKVKLLQQHEEGTAEYGATFFADLTGWHLNKFSFIQTPTLNELCYVFRGRIYKEASGPSSRPATWP